MKLAIPYDNGQVQGHLGSTEAFKFYQIEDKQVLDSAVVEAPKGGRDALFAFLVAEKVDVLVGGGMCSTAVSVLGDLGVQAFGGAEGDVDEQLEAFLADKIDFRVGAPCNHDH